MADETKLTISQALDLASELRRRGDFVGCKGLYQEILAQVPDSKAAQRGLWELRRVNGEASQFFSQYGQDEFVYREFFVPKTNGFFVDVGAYDGVRGSNTLFFERSLGWDGLCIEASPTQFTKLRENRRVKCLNACVGSFEGQADFLDIQEGFSMMSGLVSTYDERTLAAIEANPRHRGVTKPVQVSRLVPLLEEANVNHIDFCSIDVEGAELSILQAFDFERYPIDVLCVENGFAERDNADLLHSAGYERVTTIGHDDIFRRRH